MRTPETARDAAAALSRPAPGPVRIDSNTVIRQMTVLRLIAAGAGSTAEIAEAAGLSRDMVKRAIRALMRQLEATTRVHMVLLACRAGWLPEYQPTAETAVSA